MVDLSGLTKTYTLPSGPVHALRGVDLRIGRGELVAVVGPSGSGKSTLLNLLAAIDRPSEGRVVVDGVAVHELSEGRASRWRGGAVGIVFQFFQLLPTLDAIDNVVLPMDLRGRGTARSRRVRARKLLRRVGVEEQRHQLPATLSGGQRQRVAIARALANDPPLILADEPTGNLDGPTSREVMRLFLELVAEGRTVVMVTHEQELAAMATRTIDLVDGELHRA